MSPRRLVVEADGGSRGNPGVAGYGALVRDVETGALLAERAAPLGKQSNNVAEYSGLVAGLAAAQKLAPGADIEVRMDSKLVVEQMAGRWKIKHEDMRRLALQAREICAAISADGGSVRFTWIPRAENSAADKLSNDGMDGLTVERDLVPQTAQPDAATENRPQEPAGEPDLSAPTRVVLVRHGVTSFTTSGRLDGRGGADPTLSPEGLEQARAVADRLRHWLAGESAVVVTSSLARARRTGELVAEALGVTAQQDAAWDEQSFGAWDGKSTAQVAARWPDDFASLRTDPGFAPEGGESHDDVRARVLAAYERALDLAGPGGAVVVVAHRKPILVVLAEALGLDHEALFRLAVSPASITEVDRWRDGGVVVRCVNDAAHLG